MCVSLKCFRSSHHPTSVQVITAASSTAGSRLSGWDERSSLSRMLPFFPPLVLTYANTDGVRSSSVTHIGVAGVQSLMSESVSSSNPSHPCVLAAPNSTIYPVTAVQK